jgi:HlyD family secretion protein
MKTKTVLLCLAALAFFSCADRRDGSEISASGTIEARNVKIASQTAGELIELAVDEGARVRHGDKLAVIDHSSLDIQLRQAEAGMRLAQAQLALIRKGARREDIQQAEEGLTQAETAFGVAEEDVRRMRALADKGSVTPKQREDAEARLIVAQAQRSAAREGLNKVRTLSRPEEIQAAEARLAQAQAAVDLLAKTIDDCTISSPIAGMVTQRVAEIGELVAPGATLLTLSALEQVSLMIYVTEADLGSIRLGQNATVAIDAAPGRVFQGQVTYISPQAEFTPKNVQTKEDRVKLVFGVKIEIPNPDGTLKPGLPADALLRRSPGAAK